jgi:hypothetical protein
MYRVWKSSHSNGRIFTALMFLKHVQHAEQVNERYKLPGGSGEMLPDIAVQRCVLHLLELRRNVVIIFQET